MHYKHTEQRLQIAEKDLEANQSSKNHVHHGQHLIIMPAPGFYRADAEQDSRNGAEVSPTETSAPSVEQISRRSFYCIKMESGV